MKCKIENCGRAVRCRGLCRTHYRWLQEGKPFDQPIRSNPRLTLCLAPGCERAGSKYEYCYLCVRLWRKWGPVAPKRRVTEVVDAKGYVRWYPAHPENDSGKMRYAHQIIMEKSLGRALLPDENIHHKNGDRADNRLENLELWNISQPSGQRVEDKVAWAKELLRLYGD